MGRLASLRGTGVRCGAPAASLLLCAALSLTVGTQLADAVAPPTAYTGEAVQRTYSSATVKGVVSPGNQQTSYCVQYGLSSAYGAQTQVTLAGGGTQTIHVAVALTGLSVGTTYHYGLVAVNPSGTVAGQDRTFTTKKLPLLFSVVKTPARRLFARPFSLTGSLSGTGSANHAIELQANPFPYLGGFKALGNPQLTDANGVFSFAVAGLSQNTQLRVAALDTPPVNSPVMVELVAVRVTLHLRSVGRRGFARLYGTVTPSQVGGLVAFQLLRRGGTPLNVGGTVVRRASPTVSRFSRVLRIRRAGLYRAFVQVASGAQVSNHSRAILIR